MTKIDEAIVLKQFQVNELSNLPKLRMIMDAKQMKPNFSLLSRELQMNRRTVKNIITAILNLQSKLNNQKSILYVQSFKNY